jgi:glycosyltransferase involved in cell wall biosynthesis
MFFSVILPIDHHRTPGLRSISSVLLQTYPQWELLIVDTSPSADTRSPFASLSNTDRRIRLIHRPNTSLHQAYLQGLTSARGDVMVFINSGDSFTPTHLDTHHEFFHTHPRVALVMGRPTVIGSPYRALSPDADDHIHVSRDAYHGTFAIRRAAADILDSLPESAHLGHAIHDRLHREGFVTQRVSMPTYVYHGNTE